MSIVVDVHTHMVTREYLALLREKGAPKYTFRTLPSGFECIDKFGTPFFTLLPDMWNFPARIAAMDTAGVDVAVVSLTSPNAYLGDLDISVQAAQLMNNAFAEAQATWPDRIRWFASLPWQHANAAIAELKRARAMGAVGVMVIAKHRGRVAHSRPVCPDLAGDRRDEHSRLHPPVRTAGRRRDGHEEVSAVAADRFHLRHDAGRLAHAL